MSLIPIETAMEHLRADPGSEAEVQRKLTAAEISAAEFLNRSIFEDADAMEAAVALVPAALIAAGEAYEAALEAAAAITDPVAYAASVEYAESVYQQAQRAAHETRYGVVMDELIEAGILLIAGHLWENRQTVVVGASVADLPNGAHAMLVPRRIGLGV